MFGYFGSHDVYDFMDELREIERLEKLVAARVAMMDLIEKFSRKKYEISVIQKIKQSFIKQILRRNRLLPIGHRWRGDVA